MSSEEMAEKKRKRQFAAEYKAAVVGLWAKQATVDTGGGGIGPLTTAEREELAALRREVRSLKQQCEILEGRRVLSDAMLDVENAGVHAASDQCYRSPRIRRQLQCGGRRARDKRVEGCMRALGLYVGRPKRLRRATQAEPQHTPASNKLARRFDWGPPNRAWSGDDAFIWTSEGWVYLSVVVDLCTRAIVGWAVSRQCSAALTRKYLQAAVTRHSPPAGLLHYTAVARAAQRETIVP